MDLYLPKFNYSIIFQYRYGRDSVPYALNKEGQIFNIDPINWTLEELGYKLLYRSRD